MVRAFYLWWLGYNKKIFGKIIYGYQYFIRPYLPPSCRFDLSCSEYTKLAVMKYGVIKGLGKGMARLLRCQPFADFIYKSNFSE